MGDQQLGHYLRLLRLKNSLTMTQTTELTGVTQGYISQIENGVHTPSAKTLAKLARAYMVPEMHLLSKAGIVEKSGPVSVLQSFHGDSLRTENRRTDLPAPATGGSSADSGDPRDILTMLKSGLSGLEGIARHNLQQRQLSALPASREDYPPLPEFGSTMLLPVYDTNWQPLRNAAGEPAAYALPAHFCSDDESAFILVLQDDSMAPRLLAGDWVLISPAAEPQSGAVVAISDRRRIQLRAYSRSGDVQSYTPVNPEFASRTLICDGRSEKVELVGVVLRLINRNL